MTALDVLTQLKDIVTDNFGILLSLFGSVLTFVVVRSIIGSFSGDSQQWDDLTEEEQDQFLESVGDDALNAAADHNLGYEDVWKMSQAGDEDDD